MIRINHPIGIFTMAGFFNYNQPDFMIVATRGQDFLSRLTLKFNLLVIKKKCLAAFSGVCRLHVCKSRRRTCPRVAATTWPCLWCRQLLPAYLIFYSWVRTEFEPLDGYCNYLNWCLHSSSPSLPQTTSLTFLPKYSAYFEIEQNNQTPFPFPALWWSWR